MRISLAVLALLLVAAAAPAHAATIFPAGVAHPSTLPVFAGDRLAWTAWSGDGVTVHVAAADGSDRSARRFAAPIERPGLLYNHVFRFAASPSRTVAGSYVEHCAGPCKYQSYQPTFRATLSARLGEEPARLEPACAPRADGAPAVDLWNDVVAHRDACADRTLVRDLATGESFAFPAARDVRIAGPYLALQGPAALVVYEWRSGLERLRFPGPHDSFDIQPDGKIAFIRRPREGQPDLVWASPEQPEPQVLATNERRPIRQVAGDTVAYGDVGVLHIARIDGTYRGWGQGASDFDGARFAGIVKPCAVVWMATWARDEKPPEAPSGQCPLAGSRRDVLRTGDAGGGEVTANPLLACPPEPPLGCSGTVRLVTRDERSRKRLVLGSRSYEVEPGARRAVTLFLLERTICAAGRGAMRPVLEIGTYGRGGLGFERVKRRRVRLKGAERLTARCK